MVPAQDSPDDDFEARLGVRAPRRFEVVAMPPSTRPDTPDFPAGDHQHALGTGPEVARRVQPTYVGSDDGEGRVVECQSG
jgi:hypothetical protein